MAIGRRRWSALPAALAFLAVGALAGPVEADPVVGDGAVVRTDAARCAGR
jgi:hypothetical protein